MSQKPQGGAIHSARAIEVSSGRRAHESEEGPNCSHGPQTMACLHDSVAVANSPALSIAPVFVGCSMDLRVAL